MQIPDSDGIVIDGFPRDVAQALSFEDQVSTVLILSLFSALSLPGVSPQEAICSISSLALITAVPTGRYKINLPLMIGFHYFSLVFCTALFSRR